MTEMSKKGQVASKGLCGVKGRGSFDIKAKPMTGSNRVYVQMSHGTKLHEFQMINEKHMDVSIIA